MTENINGEELPKWLRYLYSTVIILVWAAVFTLCIRYRDAVTVDNIIRKTPGNRFIAFFALIALFAVKSASIFIYSGILYAASGLLFPFPLAVFTDICGSAVMFSLPYFTGRRLGADVVRYITCRYPKVEAIKKLRGSRDFRFTLAVRVIGILPLDLVSLYMGAVKVSYLQYLTGSFLALLPTMVLLTVMGKNALEPGSPQFIAAACLEAAFMLFGCILCYITLKEHRSAESDT